MTCVSFTTFSHRYIAPFSRSAYCETSSRYLNPDIVRTNQKVMCSHSAQPKGFAYIELKLSRGLLFTIRRNRRIAHHMSFGHRGFGLKASLRRKVLAIWCPLVVEATSQAKTHGTSCKAQGYVYARENEMYLSSK